MLVIRQFFTPTPTLLLTYLDDSETDVNATHPYTQKHTLSHPL